MPVHLLAAGSLALIASFAPPPATPAVPMPTQPAVEPLSSAHVWATNGNSKQELAASQVQLAQSRLESAGKSSISGSMLKSAGMTALAIAAGPIGMVAGTVVGMFGHHHAAAPKLHAVLALGGSKSETTIAPAATSFECDYAGLPGIDPDAYQPELLKLTVTKDNWRIVSLSTSSDETSIAAGTAPPKLDESPVAGASVQTLDSGHARITLSRPLAPGEYGIVLRPIGNQQNDSLQRVLRTVWDFSIAGSTAHR